MGEFLINHVEQVETGRFVQALSALLLALHDLHGWTLFRVREGGDELELGVGENNLNNFGQPFIAG